MSLPILLASVLLAAIVCAVALWSVLTDEGGDSHDFDAHPK